MDNLWAKVLPEVLQADRQALLPVHPVHLAAPLLEQKHQPCLLVLPQAKLQAASCKAVQQVYLGFQALRKKLVANWQAAQPVRLLLATLAHCEPHLHQAQLLV